MSRIAKTFARLRQRGDKALVTFVTAGDPDLSTTGELIPLLEQAGADIIELGVPFSDPMADGPTIQRSSERALAAGTDLPGILAMVRNVRERCQVPIILMGYYNPIFRYGLERFVADAGKAGVDGVLIVDLPPEEAGDFQQFAVGKELDLIYLLTPTSDANRIARVARVGRGFVYYVSVTGVTGARTAVADSIMTNVARIKERVKLPVAVGFGISTPEQAAQVAAVADGVVVGSALVKLFEEHRGAALRERLTAAVAGLRRAVDGGV